MPTFCLISVGENDGVVYPHLNHFKTEIENACQQHSFDIVQCQLDNIIALEKVICSVDLVILLILSPADKNINKYFYSLGVRNSNNKNKPTIILCQNSDDILMQILQMSTFQSVEYQVLHYDLENYKLLFDVSIENVTLIKLLKEFNGSHLSNGQLEAPVTLLEEINKLRHHNYNSEQLKKVLGQFKTRLKKSVPFSNSAFLALINAFRDIQAYDSIIELINESSILNEKLMDDPAVLYFYAFALNRRNKNGDRSLALKIIDQLLLNKKHHKSDILCLCGRIYKDKFVECQYSIPEDLNNAISWYREAFSVEANVHAGINLFTLLVVSGEQFTTSIEMQKISILLSNMIGRKGKFDTLTDYWDVATFFELNVLLKNNEKAVSASEKMFFLKPPKWYLKSTLGNISLIQHFLKTKDENQQSSSEKLLNFWVDHLADYSGFAREKITNESYSFTILMIESKDEMVPSYLVLNLEKKLICLTNLKQNVVTKFPFSEFVCLCMSKQDDLCAVLCIKTSSGNGTQNEYEFLFASGNLRAKFCAMLNESL